MLKYVVKYDGRIEDFDPEKLNKLSGYATKHGGNWSEIALECYKRLPETAKSSEILDMMVARCLDRQNIVYSRVAARLEYIALSKNMERIVGVSHSDSFETIFNALIDKGFWDKEAMPSYNPKWEYLFDIVKEERLEYWQLAQWGDKYSIQSNGQPIETPHVGAMGIALGLYGDTQDAYDAAQDIIKGKTNLPTPALNGCRNGDYDSISCCVISGGDSLPSIEVAQHIATMYTGKKAGIGIEFSVREKGSDVKGGKVKHLGFHPIYKHVDSGVKEFTQVTRGGNATVTYKVIDPDVMEIALWKTQRVDIETRIDKLDYSFAYNDAFVDAVVNKEDWYLFGLTEAPEVHEAFYTHDSKEYSELVKKIISSGKKYKTVKALDLLKLLLTARNETGRVYSFNVTRANKHSPFIETVRLSNLCHEIGLVTKPYEDMFDLYLGKDGKSKGETAFCALSAGNVSKIKEEDRPRWAYTALKGVDNMIDKAPALTPAMKESMMRRRSVGIGITGLADWLYQQGLDYDGSEQSLQACQDLAEAHYYNLLKASIKMAEEDGIAADGIDFNWLPIDTRVGKLPTKLDWESLRGKPRKHSVLVAHMPCESSSLFSSGANSLYPPRTKTIGKKSRKGIIQYICEGFDSTKKSAWQVDNITIARYYSVFQDFTDQGISADYYFDPAQYPDEKKPLSELMREWVAQARLGNKSQYYMNTRDYNGGGIHDQQGEEGCESCKL